MNAFQRTFEKVSVLCGIAGFVCFMALGTLRASPKSDKPVDRLPQASPADTGAPFLSDLLPESLSQFVVRVGSDHELVDLNESQIERFAEEMSNIESLEPDAAAILDTLQPFRIVGVGESVTLSVLKGEPIAGSAGRKRAPITSVVAATRIAFDDGSELAFANNVPLEKTITEGAIVNAGDTDILVSAGLDELVLAPGEALWVSSESDNPSNSDVFTDLDRSVSRAACSSCSVSCSGTQGACCNHKTSTSCAKCRCTAGDAGAACDAGGVGATSCSVGEAAVSDP